MEESCSCHAHAAALFKEIARSIAGSRALLPAQTASARATADSSCIADVCLFMAVSWFAIFSHAALWLRAASCRAVGRHWGRGGN